MLSNLSTSPLSFSSEPPFSFLRLALALRLTGVALQLVNKQGHGAQLARIQTTLGQRHAGQIGKHERQQIQLDSLAFERLTRLAHRARSRGLRLRPRSEPAQRARRLPFTKLRKRIGKTLADLRALVFGRQDIATPSTLWPALSAATMAAKS